MSARARARRRAEEVRLGAVQNRGAVAAARVRRAQTVHRSLLTRPLRARPSLRVLIDDWSVGASSLEMVARAEEARDQSLMLRRESLVLRNTMAWQLRRLRRTHRQVEEKFVPPLPWHDGDDDLDDIFV